MTQEQRVNVSWLIYEAISRIRMKGLSLDEQALLVKYREAAFALHRFEAELLDKETHLREISDHCHPVEAG